MRHFSILLNICPDPPLDRFKSQADVCKLLLSRKQLPVCGETSSKLSCAFSLCKRICLMLQRHFKSVSESEYHVPSLRVLSRPCGLPPVDPVPVKSSPNTCAQPAYHKIPTSLVFQSERRPVRVGPRWFWSVIAVIMREMIKRTQTKEKNLTKFRDLAAGVVFTAAVEIPL